MRYFAIVVLVAIAPLSIAGGLTGYKSGGADAPISGSVSEAGAQGAAPSLEKCAKPFGTLAVAQPQDYVTSALARFGLPPPNGLLRLMVQQSNCFTVVERGVGMQNIMQERALSEQGQLQSNQNIGKGQLVAADFLLTPEVAFSEGTAGGVGGALGAIGNLFGGVGAVVGAIAGGLKFKQAQTTLLLADARSGIQVAAAEGNVEKTDWGIGGVLGGGGAAAAVGAYGNTAEGKVIAAALLANYNNIVTTVRNNPTLVSPKVPEASSKNAAESTPAGIGMNVGDVIRPKIGGVSVLSSPNEKSKSLGKLGKSDEAIFLGDEQAGYIKIQTGSFSGWVDKRLITR